MMPDPQSDALIRQWSERFRKDALASAVVGDLRDRMDEIWRSTFELLQRESPEYRNSVDDEFTKESKNHCNELLRAIIRIAAGSMDRPTADPFDFVRTHAEWRARHRVPLIASLHAYRLAHRTYWGMTREALSRHENQEETIRSLTLLSDFWIELFDHAGAVLAEAHDGEERRIIGQSTRTYVGLIDDLLRGVEPRDIEAQQLSALCGVRTGAPLAVVVARPLPSGNGSQRDRDVTLRSFVRLVEQVLSPTLFGKLVDIRDGEVTAIVCSAGDTSRGVLAALRRNDFAQRTNGLVTAVGVSRDTMELARLPEARREARLALEFAGAGQPLLHFSDIDLQDYLIRRADAAALRLVPERARQLSAEDGDRSRELSRTIQAFADANLNVKQTARRLGVHTNTVYFRLNRIKNLTGVDPRTYSGTSLLLTALRLIEIHGERGERP